MKTKVIILSLSLILLFVGKSLTQIKNNITTDGKSFEILLANKSYIFNDEVKNQFTVRDYFEFTDESSAGKYKLPSMDVIVAIPSESNPKISIVAFTEKKYQNLLPKLNPKVEMVNDSTFNIKEVDYSERKAGTYPLPLIEFKGFLWLRDFYCVHI